MHLEHGDRWQRVGGVSLPHRRMKGGGPVTVVVAGPPYLPQRTTP